MEVNYLLLAVALGMIYLIWRVARDIFETYQCVEESALRDFLYGRLKRGSARYRQVVRHLGNCEQCQEKLREVQRGKRLEDHLVDE